MISIADESCYSIQVCLWAEQGHKFNQVDDHPVIAIKGARVVEYNGKSLNVSEETYITIDPALNRTDDLKRWWESLEGNKEQYLKPINKTEKECKF